MRLKRSEGGIGEQRKSSSEDVDNVGMTHLTSLHEHVHMHRESVFL